MSSYAVWSPGLGLKRRRIYEKCVYGGTLLPKAYNVQASDVLQLAKRPILGGGGTHRRIEFKFEYLGKFEFILERALRYQSER
jgi:hypothetical protein